MTSLNPTDNFQELVDQVGDIGRKKHSEALLENARRNLSKLKKSIRELPVPSDEKTRSAIVISAGPSVHRKNSIERIKNSGYKGATVCVDGAYLACLRRGLIPDYMLTLDPHPTRIVRWFGDPDYEANCARDDYFERQDLNVEMRTKSLQKNREDIALVNEHGHKTKAIVSTSAPEAVVRRIEEGKFDTYWWNPLVDDPRKEGSLTRSLYNINKLPCLNTGGNVGTASWVFASQTLKARSVGLVGMDFGYFSDLPIEKTQGYYELILHLGGPNNLEKYFTNFTFPLTGERFYTDVTYFWYRRNFLELIDKSPARTFNCTEGGTLFSDNVRCERLEDFMRNYG